MTLTETLKDAREREINLRQRLRDKGETFAEIARKRGVTAQAVEISLRRDKKTKRRSRPA